MNAEHHKAEGRMRRVEGAFWNPPAPFPLLPSRCGLTLIELLVVIIILTTIVAAVIPILAPAGDDRRLREAARGVNTYITGAQTRAIAANRPFGVALKRLSQETNNAEDNSVSLELFYVEQPPPYAGFDPNSRVMVCLHPDGMVVLRFVTRGTSTSFGLPPGWVADLFPSMTIRPGDAIVIGDTRYELLDSRNVPRPPRGVNLPPPPPVTGGFYGPFQPGMPAHIYGRPTNDSGQLINPWYDNQGREIGSVNQPNPPYWTKPLPYKILRQPMPAPDQPYQLPEGAAIDLRASGVGVNDYFYVPGRHDNDALVMIMFSPEGKVSRLRFNRAPTAAEWFDEPVTDNLFLLVGKRENSPPPPADPGADPSLQVSPDSTEQERAKLREPINWLSGFSRWVVIGSQTGRIVTIENAFVDLLAPATFSGDWEESRNAQILAAREFTREMAQLGGR